jgi:hypothetical protein
MAGPARCFSTLAALLGAVALLVPGDAEAGRRRGGGTGAAPEIVLTSPVHGAFSTDAGVLVSGHVSNVNTANAQVTVNGAPVSLAGDGSFQALVPLDASAVLNPVLAELRRAFGDVLLDRERIVVIAGESIADGDLSPASSLLRLNDRGLDQMEPLIQSLVAGDLDIQSLIIAQNPVVQQSYCVLWLIVCIAYLDVDVNVQSVSFSSFFLDVDSLTNFVAGDIVLSNLLVTYHATGVNCDGRITANSVTILGDYGLDPDALDPTTLDVNLNPGTIGVSFSNFDNEFTSGICDFPFIGDLIQLILGNVEPLVVDGLESSLDDPDGGGPLDSPIADGIEVALAGIEISGPLGESLGVVLDTPLFSVTEDVDGITLGSDTAMTADFGTGPGQCDPPPGSPDFAASYHVSESFPSLGATTPGGGLPFGLGICISTSAFNQLMKADVECGLLQIDLTELDLGAGPQPLTAGLLAALIPEFGALDPLLPMTIELRPSLAPIVTGNAGPGGELAELRVGQLLGNVVSDDGAGGQTVHLRIAVDFRSGLELAFDPATGGLAPSLGAVTASEIGVAILDNPIGTNELVLQLVLPTLIALVLPDLATGLGALPLPAFLGLDLQGVEVGRQGEFMSLFLDLAPAGA